MAIRVGNIMLKTRNDMFKSDGIMISSIHPI